MDFKRRLNAALGGVTGLEVKRVGSSSVKPQAKPPPEPKPKRPTTSFRPPSDPKVDRLLSAPVFIMAPVRSGSTLLRMLLGGHSELHAPHELHVRRLQVEFSTKLSEEAMAALDLTRGDLEHLLWDRVLHRELVKSGKSYIVEKTPGNAFAWQRIAACWPDAKFVFLLRHPMSIAQSWHEARPDKGDLTAAAVDALRFMKAVEKARDGLSGLTTRYEDIVADPQAETQRICSFLGLDWEPEMLSYGDRSEEVYQKGLGDWKDKIRTGSVQEGRPLPGLAETPDELAEVCRSWGYATEGAAPR